MRVVGRWLSAGYVPEPPQASACLLAGLGAEIPGCLNIGRRRGVGLGMDLSTYRRKGVHHTHTSTQTHVCVHVCVCSRDVDKDKVIVAKFPHAPNSQPQRTRLSNQIGLRPRVWARWVAGIHISFDLHSPPLITWPAGNLYPLCWCDGWWCCGGGSDGVERGGT